MRYGECVRRGVLKRVGPDIRRAVMAAEIARMRPEEELFKEEILSGSLILSYTATFHSVRALLFRDGWVERSHACAAAYPEETYVKSGKLERGYLSIFNAGRMEGHEALCYHEISVSREEDEHILKRAKGIRVPRCGNAGGGTWEG
jgi:uncharacterized protein (UPF0332 family)